MLPIFRSEAQLRMLARLLLQPDQPATAAELQEASGMSKASLHRELLRATDAGLVDRDESRRPHVFRAARSSPMYDAVASLLRMTVGAEIDIQQLLAATPRVQAAAIHGSWADDRARPSSDIDLIVVGDVDGRRLRAQLRKLGTKLGREIDLTLLTSSNFAELVRSENPFLRVVLDRPFVNVVGDISDLADAA